MRWSSFAFSAILSAAACRIQGAHASDPSEAACVCDAGSCDQAGCTASASCEGGLCRQTGLFAPTCDGGRCDQRGATNPSCNGGSCMQREAVNPACEGGECCQSDAFNPSCVGGDCGCGGDAPAPAPAPGPSPWWNPNGPSPWERGGTCDCGAGHCDQRGCTAEGATCGAGHCNQSGLKSPSCGAGHCNQEGAENPSCNAGHCNQRNAANPSCNAGHCCQDGSTNPTCNAGQCNCLMCIGGETLLFSCTADAVVAARDVSIGDKVRAYADGESVCSDVYYVYSHGITGDESDFAVKITTSGDDSFLVSYDHIVYVGEAFEERQPVRAQDVKPGDRLVPANSNGAIAEVVEVETVRTDLVNVLTLHPHLEVQTSGGGGGGIVISAHSVDEEAYGALFAPVRYAYLAFGPKAVEYMAPLFGAVDYTLSRPGLRLMKWIYGSDDGN